MKKQRKYIGWLLYFFFSYSLILSQEFFCWHSLSSKEKTLIDPSYLSLQFPGDSNYFHAFFQKFTDLLFFGKGKIQIMHIGGSHVQADLWTNTLRQHFYTFLPGTRSCRGYFFPYKMAKTNNPSSYKVNYTGTWKYSKCTLKDTTYRWGLAGYEVTTYDTLASIEILFDSIQYAPFTHLRIYCPSDSTSYTITPAISPEQYRCTAITPSYLEFSFSQPMYRLSLRIQKTNSCQQYFKLLGMEVNNDDPGIVIHSIGVNGASLPSYLRCQLLPTHYNTIKPDLIILSVGINDANEPEFDAEKYKSNYDSLIAILLQHNPDTRIIFTTINDSYYKKRFPNPNGELVQIALYELAKKYNAGYWDMFSLMGKLGSSKKWMKEGYMQADKVHFTKTGYELLGKLLFNAIMNRYGEYLYYTAKLD